MLCGQTFSYMLYWKNKLEELLTNYHRELQHEILRFYQHFP